MRTSSIITALFASVVAVSALPLPLDQAQARDVDSPLSNYLGEQETAILNSPTTFGLPAIPNPGNSKSGSLIGQRDVEELEERSKHKHHKGRDGAIISPRITFYSGNQLANPACGGSTPSPHAMIAAVKNGGAFSCGDRIHIQNGAKHVTVHVVDYCESCSPHAVDLSPGAFLQLASLDTGIISGAKMWKL